MSVTFSIRAVERPEDEPLNLSNANARELLLVLGLPIKDLHGSVRGIQLRKVCEWYLARRESDPAKVWRQEGNYVECGREAGYIMGRVRQLLTLAEEAGDLGTIDYG